MLWEELQTVGHPFGGWLPMKKSRSQQAKLIGFSCCRDKHTKSIFHFRYNAPYAVLTVMNYVGWKLRVWIQILNAVQSVLGEFAVFTA